MWSRSLAGGRATAIARRAWTGRALGDEGKVDGRRSNHSGASPVGTVGLARHQGSMDSHFPAWGERPGGPGLLARWTSPGLYLEISEARGAQPSAAEQGPGRLSACTCTRDGGTGRAVVCSLSAACQNSVCCPRHSRVCGGGPRAGSQPASRRPLTPLGDGIQ